MPSNRWVRWQSSNSRKHKVLKRQTICIMAHTLRLVLGDQLNEKHPWFQQVNPEVLYVMMEIRPEATYVTHHIQKLLGFFGAMRCFKQRMESQGHRFRYFHLNDADNAHSFKENLEKVITEEGIQHFAYQLPDEYRLYVLLNSLAPTLSLTSYEAVESHHFLTTRYELATMFKGKKQFLMERFYRKIRKNYDVLMEPSGKPIGSKWNYDAQNRQKYKGEVSVPPPLTYQHNLSELASTIQDMEIPSIGTADAAAFSWPLHREEALEVLQYFTQHLLIHFGTYQDAMHTQYPYLFHSRLSFALNVKMLHPLEVVEAATQAWEQNDEISIAQVEGFIRQIIGWREYMRGIYWAKMPDFAQLNYFEHTRKLPDFYWDGATHMRCLKEAIRGSLTQAYAHHIQRLMVTGNFALLAGISPDEVDQWYLGIYIDALEWVEITNTRGMSQFADGGIVGTKPYVSSANYIHKMGNYCSKCSYDHKKKYGENACPFNSLYWDFYHRNREKLEKNPRIGMMYRTWDKMQEEEKTKILAQAERYLANIETL